MVQRRINLKELVLGEAARWNPFGSKAARAADSNKAALPAALSPPDSLLAEPGLFAEAERPPSVLHQLNQCNRRLERLLLDLRNEHNAEGELRDIARDVITATDLNPDIALACILLSQIAGTYAVRHCIETALVGVVVARGMGKSDADTLTVTVAALTMNVGMLRHHEGFQNKNAPLTREEMAIVRRHPEESADLLKCAGIADEEWLSCVLLHHENDNGSGYPAGVSSPQVTQNAKLINLADRYCAQVSARNYRRSLAPDAALRNLLEDEAAPVDAALAQHFAREVGAYPPGCLVRLENGEVAVVAKRDQVAGCLVMHSLRDSEGAVLPPGLERRSSDAGCSVSAVAGEAQALRFSMKQVWGEQASL